MPKLAQPDGIYVLQLGDDENRFTLEWIKQIHAHLDEIVGSPAPLVTTAVGKFYSNGLDLEWVLSNSGQLPSYVARVQSSSPAS
jgi:enoyl-CoA hydratase/carnithine racemase